MSKEKNLIEQQEAGKKRTRTQTCPYLDTIQRKVLDFDFERSCSVSLQSGPHIYGCLVCGRFFRGKGRQTPAFIHSVDEGHSVFVHLTKGTFWCLPDDYEVIDPSLMDISAALNPTYRLEDTQKLDQNHDLSRDLYTKRYLPGYVGLNNLKKTDYINATIQALAQVRPLRDFFLQAGVSIPLPSKETNQYAHLARCFGELMRKIWSDKRFRSNVDPHEMIQAISAASSKRFHVGKQAEASAFLSWLLNCLHIGVGGTRKAGSSIIHKTFQGVVELTIRQRKKVLDVDLNEELDDRVGSEDEEEFEKKEEERLKKLEEAKKETEIDEQTIETKFLHLTLDMPEKPLFKDDEGGLVIPQEPLFNVLQKFNGEKFCDTVQGGVPQKRRYRLRKLPNYLVLHLARFKRNNFYNEKNPTIVTFPVKNLDLSQYVFPKEGEAEVPTEEQIRKMNTKELKKFLKKYGKLNIVENAVEKSEIVDAVIDFVKTKLMCLLLDKYDLIANICHDSPSDVGKEGKRDPLEEGSYRCHVQHRASSQWYEIQDLHVQETMPQLIGLSESYLLIFERKGMADS